MEALPFTPRGLSRKLAALYVGVSPSAFDHLVVDGRLPQPLTIEGHLVWDRFALDAAFTALPTKTECDGGRSIDAKQKPLPPVFTPKTLAAAWGCSERHVRKLIQTGELRCFTLGGKLIRIRREEAETYEARQAISAS